MDIENYLKKAQKEGWAIGQFNVSNLETLRGIVQATQELRSPVIIGTSEGESSFLGLKQIAVLVKSFREEFSLPIFLNLDHGKSFEYIKKAVDSGYDTVHFDGSKLPLDENIKIAKEVTAYGRKKGVLVEGEVGVIKGASEIHKEEIEVNEEDLTDADEALKFLEETKVDSLAVNIGTFHGVDSFGGKPHINVQRLEEIKEKIDNKAFLVLHGGSGLQEEDVKEAIKSGIVKININTELRLAFTDSLRKVLEEIPEETTPYKYMPKVIEAIRRVVEEKIKLFNSINKI